MKHYVFCVDCHKIIPREEASSLFSYEDAATAYYCENCISILFDIQNKEIEKKRARKRIITNSTEALK